MLPGFTVPSSLGKAKGSYASAPLMGNGSGFAQIVSPASFEPDGTFGFTPSTRVDNGLPNILSYPKTQQARQYEPSGQIVPAASCPSGYVGKVVCNVQGHCGVICVPIIPPPPPACPTWLPGVTKCGKICVNTTGDWGNCGLCGHGCPIPVGAGGACCSGACVDLSSDVNNCGGCGNVCATPLNAINVTCTGIFVGGAISGAVCDFSCPSGLTKCDQTHPTGCFDISSDTNNCGGCGHVCPELPNSTPTCAGGVCGFNCNAGFLKCGNTCCPPGPANSTSTCTFGQLCGWTCNSGFTKCGNSCCSSSMACCHGACLDPMTFSSDQNNCGGCGNVCPGGDGCCSGGQCGSLCGPTCCTSGNECCTGEIDGQTIPGSGRTCCPIGHCRSDARPPHFYCG